MKVGICTCVVGSASLDTQTRKKLTGPWLREKSSKRSARGNARKRWAVNRCASNFVGRTLTESSPSSTASPVCNCQTFRTSAKSEPQGCGFSCPRSKHRHKQATGRLTFHLLGAVASSERDLSPNAANERYWESEGRKAWSLDVVKSVSDNSLQALRTAYGAGERRQDLMARSRYSLKARSISD